MTKLGQRACRGALEIQERGRLRAGVRLKPRPHTDMRTTVFRDFRKRMSLLSSDELGGEPRDEKQSHHLVSASYVVRLKH